MDKQTDLPQITNKQDEIVILLYRFRFLNRKQIQKILHHKQFSKIIEWLNDLVQKRYLTKFYTEQFPRKSAVYCLSTPSREYIKNTRAKVVKNKKLLDRIYKERNHSETLQKHCQFLAGIYISLMDSSKENNATLHFFTKTDLYSTEFIVKPTPDAYFMIQKEESSKRYFLDIFDQSTPKILLRRRVFQYLSYYRRNEWQENNKNPFPKVVLICPNDSSKEYLKKFINETSDRNNGLEISFYTTTWDIVKEKGVNIHSLEKIN